MTHRDFCYWLRGYVESVEEYKNITEKDWEIIKKHLDICFNCEPKVLNDPQELPKYTMNPVQYPPNMWNLVKYMPAGSC